MTVENLLSELGTLGELIINFNALYKNSQKLICFYEGKDYAYYHPRIGKYYNKSSGFESIQCGGKKKVLDMFDWIHNNGSYDMSIIAFFVDRDFDESIKGKKSKRIYETPCYSIENLYCGKEVLSEILKHKFNIHEHVKDFSTIIDKYSELENNYLESSVLFNAWYKLQKGNVDVKIKKDSLIPKYIEVTFDLVKKRYTESSLCKEFPNYSKYEQSTISGIIDILRKEGLLKSLRGKYNLSFFIKFLELITREIKLGKEFKKKDITFNIDKSEQLSILSCFAVTPPCLIDFIKQFN